MKPVPLSQVPEGRTARVVSIAGGKGLLRRLIALGISVDTELQILQRRGHGVVVARDGNRIALGGGIAEKLLSEILTP